ncbi:MAG: glycoside hydrolase family 18 protein [bacterium]
MRVPISLSRGVVFILFLLALGACSGGSGGGSGGSSGQGSTGTPSNPTSNSPGGNTPASVGGRWLTAYYPSYQQFTMAPSEVDYASLTHLIHWPVLPKPDGTLETAKTDFTAAHSADVVSRAHGAGIKVLLGVGGDADSGATAGFQGATQPANRANFINNIVSLMQSRGYDGVDINWEQITAADDANFVAFIQELRQALDKVSPRPLLTMPPTTGSDSRPDLIAKVANQFDQINLQTYVMSGAYPGWVTWFNSPVSNGGAEFPGSPGERLPSIEDEVKRFADAGIPLNKMAIGIQFSAFVWAGGSGTDTGGATKPRQSWKTPPTVTLISYTDAINTLTAAQGFRKNFDATAKVPYLSLDSAKDADDRFVSFDDEQAIQEKANYLKSKGLAGAFIFEVSGDYFASKPAGQKHPLLNASKQFLLDGFVKAP